MSSVLRFLAATLLALAASGSLAQSQSAPADTVFKKHNTLLPLYRVDSTQIPQDGLPLAEDKQRLSRPKFPHTHAEISLGWASSEMHELERLIGSAPSSSLLIGFGVHYPFTRSPSLAAVFGWSLMYSNDGSLLQFDVSLQMRDIRPVPWLPLVMGIGVGNIHFGTTSGGYDVSATQTFMLLIGGVTLVRDHLDLLYTYPFSSAVSYEFEGGLYTVQPAGPAISLVLAI